MADAPEALTYADLLMAQTAVELHADRLREAGGRPDVNPDTRSTIAERVAAYDRLGAKLGRHAVHVLNTGDFEAQRAETYR